MGDKVTIYPYKLFPLTKAEPYNFENAIKPDYLERFITDLLSVEEIKAQQAPSTINVLAVGKLNTDGPDTNSKDIFDICVFNKTLESIDINNEAFFLKIDERYDQTFDEITGNYKLTKEKTIFVDFFMKYKSMVLFKVLKKTTIAKPLINLTLKRTAENNVIESFLLTFLTGPNEQIEEEEKTIQLGNHNGVPIKYIHDFDPKTDYNSIYNNGPMILVLRLSELADVKRPKYVCLRLEHINENDMRTKKYMNLDNPVLKSIRITDLLTNSQKDVMTNESSYTNWVNSFFHNNDLDRYIQTKQRDELRFMMKETYTNKEETKKRIEEIFKKIRDKSGENTELDKNENDCLTMINDYYDRIYDELNNNLSNSFKNKSKFNPADIDSFKSKVKKSSKKLQSELQNIIDSNQTIDNTTRESLRESVENEANTLVDKMSTSFGILDKIFGFIR